MAIPCYSTTLFNGHVSSIHTDAPYDSGDPGVTSVGTLEVKNLGKITVTMDPLNPIMTAGNFTVKNGFILVEFFIITA
jgi:hypothetical protein